MYHKISLLLMQNKKKYFLKLLENNTFKVTKFSYLSPLFDLTGKWTRPGKFNNRFCDKFVERRLEITKFQSLLERTYACCLTANFKWIGDRTISRQFGHTEGEKHRKHPDIYFTRQVPIPHYACIHIYIKLLNYKHAYLLT